MNKSDFKPISARPSVLSRLVGGLIAIGLLVLIGSAITAGVVASWSFIADVASGR